MHPSLTGDLPTAPPGSATGPTVVRATCPRCDDVVLRPDDLRARVCFDTRETTYCFRCPSCLAPVVKQADERILDALLHAGATPDVWRLPAELTEVHDGPPRTPDDLLDFHLLLEEDDWFDRLASGPGAA